MTPRASSNTGAGTRPIPSTITCASSTWIRSSPASTCGLDYVDEVRSRDPVTGRQFSRYTGDQATLHLDNGLKRGYEHKRFGSLFLSKPFGPSQEHRINNIAIFEEGGGWWNRLDLEYTIRDELLATLAWNHYWGSEDTLFGQFGESSNIQLGIKYLFE